MSYKRDHPEEDSGTDKGTSSSTPGGDVLSPRKNPRYDFFADLKKRKEGEKVIKIQDLVIGKNCIQDIIVSVAWKLRHPDRYFSFQGFDGSSYIVFKAFTRAIPQLRDKIEVFRTYKICNFTVAKVDDKFRTMMDGQFEIILSTESIVELIDDKITIPFNPIPLNELSETQADAVIDAQGILVFTEEVRKTSSNKLVREVSMIDKSELTVPVYFWGKDAEEFDLPLRVPIGFRNVQVKSYGEEKVLWFQWSSSADTTNVDLTGEMAKWFKDLTEGYM